MEVRLYDSKRDVEQLREFYEKAFGASSSVPAENLVQSDDQPYAGPTVIALENGVIVGHLKSIRHDLWYEGKEIPAYWLNGFHVLPGLRGRGVAKKLVACMNEALPVLYTVPVIDASLRAFQANQWIFPGKIRESIHVAKPGKLDQLFSSDRIERFLPGLLKRRAGFWARAMALPCRLLISAHKACFRIPAQIASGRKTGFQAVDTFDESVDRLWEKMRGRFTLTNVRRAHYLNWMFPAARNWRKVMRSVRGETQAWIVYALNDYRQGPLRGFRTLNIIDALWDHDVADETANIMHFILSLGYSEDVDLILISGTDWFGNVAKKAAFLPIPSTVHVGFWSGETTGTFRNLYRKAYITRGFSEAAGNLGPL